MRQTLNLPDIRLLDSRYSPMCLAGYLATGQCIFTLMLGRIYGHWIVDSHTCARPDIRPLNSGYSPLYWAGYPTTGQWIFTLVLGRISGHWIVDIHPCTRPDIRPLDSKDSPQCYAGYPATGQWIFTLLLGQTKTSSKMDILDIYKEAAKKVPPIIARPPPILDNVSFLVLQLLSLCKQMP